MISQKYIYIYRNSNKKVDKIINTINNTKIK